MPHGNANKYSNNISTDAHQWFWHTLIKVTQPTSPGCSFMFAYIDKKMQLRSNVRYKMDKVIVSLQVFCYFSDENLGTVNASSLHIFSITSTSKLTDWYPNLRRA